MGLRVQGFKVWGVECGVQGVGCGVKGGGFRVKGFKVWGRGSYWRVSTIATHSGGNVICPCT